MDLATNDRQIVILLLKNRLTTKICIDRSSSSSQTLRQVAVVEMLYTAVCLPHSLAGDTAPKNVSNAAYRVLLHYQTQDLYFNTTQLHRPVNTHVQLHYGTKNAE